jgi:hypothetical protein
MSAPTVSEMSSHRPFTLAADHAAVEGRTVCSSLGFYRRKVIPGFVPGGSVGGWVVYRTGKTAWPVS